MIRVYHPAQVKLLAEFWARQRPDMVISVVPNFDRALFESLEKALPGVPFVTILTDLADYPPHFWIEKQKQYLICGTNRAVEQARAFGHETSRVFRASGMILRPEFYEKQTSDRAAERQRLGLDPNLPTGLVLFGGQGSNVMLAIAERLGNSALDLQLILICGRNQKLQTRLAGLQNTQPDFRRRVHKADSVLHASERFLHRQAGTGQRLGGRAYGPAGDCRAECLDASAGALQRGVDS